LTAGDKDPDIATTLVKGLKVLEAFRPNRTLMSNGEIARETGINRSTVTRLTYTLQQTGYLRQEKTKYRLSWRALMLVNPLLVDLKLLHIARPSMQKLAQDLGGTVSIGTMDRGNFVYLETSRVNENIWSSPDLGTIGPLLPAAIGHALCSLLTEDELKAKLEELKRRPDLWVKYADSFIQGVRDCRARGFSVVKGTWIPGTHSAGVPLIRDANGDCFGINCRVPIYRLSPNQIEDEVAPRLISLATNIRNQLAYIMPA
jgi:DNA-binding IclR family transcriptional regulator